MTESRQSVRHIAHLAGPIAGAALCGTPIGMRGKVSYSPRVVTRARWRDLPASQARCGRCAAMVARQGE